MHKAKCEGGLLYHSKLADRKVCSEIDRKTRHFPYHWQNLATIFNWNRTRLALAGDSQKQAELAQRLLPPKLRFSPSGEYASLKAESRISMTETERENTMPYRKDLTSFF